MANKNASTDTDKYPALSYVLGKLAVKMFRGPLFATVFCIYVWHPFYKYAMSISPFEDDRINFTVGSMTLRALLYFGLNFFFLFCDSYGYLKQYKLPRTPGQIPSSALIRKTIFENVINQFVISPFTFMLVLYPIFKLFGTPAMNEPLPGFSKLFIQFFLCNLANMTGFYWAHRLCHESKWMYANIHKQHHEYSGSIGFAAEYAHPLEQILANQAPSTIGALVQGVHFSTFMVWLMWRLENTYEGHSGYCFSGSWLDSIGLLNAPEAAYHDFHHTKNKGNYGSGEFLWDYFCGTSHGWYESELSKYDQSVATLSKPKTS